VVFSVLLLLALIILIIVLVFLIIFINYLNNKKSKKKLLESNVKEKDHAGGVDYVIKGHKKAVIENSTVKHRKKA